LTGCAGVGNDASHTRRHAMAERFDAVVVGGDLLRDVAAGD
jgi:hypothetical protein